MITRRCRAFVAAPVTPRVRCPQSVRATGPRSMPLAVPVSSFTRRLQRNLVPARVSPSSGRHGSRALRCSTGASPTPTDPAREKMPDSPAPAPGGKFYLGVAGLCTLCAVATPQVLAGSRPETWGVHYTMLGLVYAFALMHSGLASLRPMVAKVIGERAYRVLFALLSIPGAVGTIGYFVAHRYDGAQLWRLQGITGVHEMVWALTALSFYFLYPATFNLAEVAAIKRPGFRIYEAGVMRITRHPQLWGQVMWCVAHTAWIGTSFGVAASFGLIAHHAFAVWNGDRRLKGRYGEAWDDYAARTSVVPFRALVDGRQKLSWEELPLKAYLGVTVFILGTYVSHAAMLRLAAGLL